MVTPLPPRVAQRPSIISDEIRIGKDGLGSPSEHSSLVSSHDPNLFVRKTSALRADDALVVQREDRLARLGSEPPFCILRHRAILTLSPITLLLAALRASVVGFFEEGALPLRGCIDWPRRGQLRKPVLVVWHNDGRASERESELASERARAQERARAHEHTSPTLNTLQRELG